MDEDNQKQFSREDLEKLSDSLDKLKKILGPKLVTLTKEQRQSLGSLTQADKLFIEKVKSEMDANPDLCDPSIDREKFNEKYETAQFLDSILPEIENMCYTLEQARKQMDKNMRQKYGPLFKAIKAQADLGDPEAIEKLKLMRPIFPEDEDDKMEG